MITLLQTSGTRTSVRTRTYELETAEADIDAKVVWDQHSDLEIHHASFRVRDVYMDEVLIRT